MKKLILLLVFPALVAFASDAVAREKTAKLTLKVAGMACEGCSAHVDGALAKLEGVLKVVADHKTATVVVYYHASRLPEKRIRQKIVELGYVIGDKDPPVVYAKGTDMKVLSKKGEDVRVEKHLAIGKVTVVDFYADWCKPCKALDRRLAAKTKLFPTRLAVRKINIVDWDSPVTKHYLKDVKGLPYVRVYDQRGRFVRALAGDDIGKLDSLINKLLRK